MDKAAWAKNLSLDPLWQEMIAELKAIEIAKFENSSDDDIDTRENAYKRIRAIDSIVSHVDWMASTSKMDEKRLKFF